MNNLLPSQASASGKYLKSNGTDSSWDALDISTADITGTLPVANGGTGVTSSTGTGSVVLSNSPTLVTPALGTPASGVATNLTGLPLSTGVTGTLPIANGGTGQTTANAAFNALAPSQATASGKYLKSDGTNTSWDALDISTADITGTLPVANGGTGVTTSTGTGSVVLSNSPTLVTPALGTPSSGTLTNATGLPISTGVSGLGTGVATALAVNVGSAGAPVVNGGALGTPSSGTVTNLTGTASININGTVGATTPTTGAFTTLSASSSVTLSGGTANGVTYLNGSKVLTSGSALTFDGTNLGVGVSSPGNRIALPNSSYISWKDSAASGETFYIGVNSSNVLNISANYASGQTAFSTGGSEQMRLTSTGLGIGTSSPNFPVTVYNASAQIQFINSATGTTNASGFKVGLGGGSSTDAYINQLGNAAIIFNTNATERMRLDSSGNLGLGVTPSAWSTSGNLQLPTSKAIGFAGTVATVASNWYYNAADKYVGNGYAAAYQQNSGSHVWYTAGNNTSGAGAALSFTQAMTLDASGNLGVGTTSPAGRVDAYGDGTNPAGVFRRGGAYGNIESSDAGRSNRWTLGRDNASTGNFVIAYNDSTKASIDSSGNLLVGTTSGYGNRRFEVRGGVDGTYLSTFANTLTSGAPSGLQIYYPSLSPNGTSSQFISCADSTTTRFDVRSNGGIANYQANDANLSDRREKTNFAPATSYLDKICAIPVQTFNYIDQNLEEDDGLTLGVVAQDVQAVAPELVMESNWGTEEEPKMRLSIYQTDLQYALMKCIQEQQAIIESLKARLDAANL